MRYLYLLVSLLFVQFASATDHVYLHTVPDTLAYHNVSPYSYTLDVDVNNDGVNDIMLIIQNTGNTNLDVTAQSDNSSTGWKIEVDELYPGPERALPYNCGAFVNTGEGFNTRADMSLFNGHGARYISVRKLLASNWYNYGWIKIDVSPSGGTMIVYATGYSDELSYYNDTDHQVGLAECTATSIDETQLSDLQMYASADQLHVNGTTRAAINVYDVAGKIVTAFNYNGQSNTYDLHNLSAGCYIVEALAGDAKKVTKVIVQ